MNYIPATQDSFIKGMNLDPDVDYIVDVSEGMIFILDDDSGEICWMDYLH